MPDTRRHTLWLRNLAASMWVVLDQLTKWWADTALTYGRPREILPVLDFTLLYNHGAAFSFLSDAGGWQRWMFVCLSAVVSLFLLVWIPKQTNLLARTAFTFVLAGAVGNLIDRVRFGYVVDFIHAHWNHNYFPAFNLADAAISVGVCLLLVEWLQAEKGSQSA